MPSRVIVAAAKKAVHGYLTEEKASHLAASELQMACHSMDRLHMTRLCRAADVELPLHTKIQRDHPSKNACATPATLATMTLRIGKRRMRQGQVDQVSQHGAPDPSMSCI